MAPWYQKYRLKWPWTPTQVANTDQMFSEIYSAIKELKDAIDGIIASGNSSSTTASQPTIIIDSLSGDSNSSDGFVGLSRIPGPQGIQGIQGTMGPPGIEGSSDDSSIFYTINNNSSSGEISITTTGNIDDLDFGNVSLIRMNNASLSTIRGLKSGYAGQKVVIVSVGAGQVDLAHQNTGSIANNRLINTTTSAASSLAAGSGICIYEYDITTARWRLISHIQGANITPAFSAGDFTGDISTWTVASGDVQALSYYLKDNLLYVFFSLITTSVGIGNNLLKMANGQFGGFTFSKDAFALLGFAFDAGVSITAYSQIGGGTTYIAFGNQTTAVWTTSTDTTYLYGVAVGVVT